MDRLWGSLVVLQVMDRLWGSLVVLQVMGFALGALGYGVYSSCAE